MRCAPRVPCPRPPQSGHSCCLRHRPPCPILPPACLHVTPPPMYPPSTRQYASVFNQPLSFDTSSVTDMGYMFNVRSARFLPSASTVRAFLLLAPPTTPPHPPDCLPACRPSSYASPLSTRQQAREFNQPLSLGTSSAHKHRRLDTSSVTNMRAMLSVRSARAPPSGASLLLAPPTTPPHPPACLPACRPAS